MGFALRSIIDFSHREVAELFTRSFAGYFFDLEIDKGGLYRMMSQEGVDADCSRVVLRNDEPVGIALIARRGWTSRLAAMGIIKEARGQGIGRWFMPELLAEARERGERKMVLEVIEQNVPAVHLYQRSGFQIVRRLVGFHWSPTAGDLPENSIAPTEVDIYEVAQLVMQHGLPDLPWQLAADSLIRLGRPNRAYRLAEAYAIISNPEQDNVGLRSLLVLPASRGQGQARQLIHALAAHFAQKTWRVPIICPEELGGIYRRMGFQPESLSQLQMVARL